MKEESRRELEEFLAYKKMRSSTALERTFYALELALINANARIDGTMSVRSFRLLSEALMSLKDEFLDFKTKMGGNS